MLIVDQFPLPAQKTKFFQQIFAYLIFFRNFGPPRWGPTEITYGDAGHRGRQTMLTDVARRHKAHSCLRSPHAKRFAGFFGDPFTAEK